MSKYGYCEDCGCILEKVGCPNCNEIEVNDYYNYLNKINSEQEGG